MESAAVEKPTVPADEDVSSANIVELASDWLSTKTSRISTIAQLAMAEAQLAAVSVALMAFLAALGAIFVFTAWALIVAALVNGLLNLGLPLWMILIGTAIVHLAIAAILWVATLRIGRNVEFRATREHLSASVEDAS